MARFNQAIKGSNKTTNHEGEVSYKVGDKLDLYSTVCTASLQNKFYESANETMTRIRALVQSTDPEFIMKLAIYTRENMYLRSVPLVLLVELAKIGKLRKNVVKRVIQRADEITELLSYYQSVNMKKGSKRLGKLSKAIQEGIKDAFESGKFDEYQFSKYNRDTDVKLKDALFLTHPKPVNKEMEQLFKKIANDNLEIAYTWETELSKAGQEKKDKKEVWHGLIDSKKVGYMALLRNLRNILDAKADLDHVKKVAEYLSNPEAVKKSKQLPFRFVAAYRELQSNKNPHTGIMLNALEDAMLVSAENIKGYGYDTSVMIASDVSGSMETNISPKSTIRYYDIGLILSCLLQNRCKASITGVFGERWEIMQMPNKAILSNYSRLQNLGSIVGHSTNAWKAMKWLLDHKEKMDKIMVFTDMQVWNDRWGWGSGHETLSSLWTKYKNDINPDAKIYIFDLAGYGKGTPIQVDGNGVHFIAGWSDKVFDILAAIEEGSSAVKEIEKIEI